MEEFQRFEWAGVHFGEEETYLLQRSLTKLSHDTKAKSIKFWGKIFGSKKDYYIAELDQEGNAPDGAEPDPEDPKLEARGTGVNQYNYFVTNDILGEWTPLPVITPDQLTQSRKIKYIFTGNLDATIVTNPPFQWSEKYYLRAQIARISHSTNIIPSGLWKINADSDEPTQEELLQAREITETDPEEVKQATLQQLTSLKNWQHYMPAILKEGRTTYSEAPDFVNEMEEAEREQWEKDRARKDPLEYRLKALSDDKPLNGYKQAWTLRTCGDTIEYDTISEKKEKTSYCVLALKSQVWPGAMTIAYGNKW
mmetsp:Transcript_29838/g.27325  ORF Transcript_29838/g.27325 Transcript_29838/m.27325 type:complete len:310 (-) Transcript_29838:289-1218(-)